MNKDAITIKDWYERNIEEPIRPLFCLLRDNGINTVCSCGHEMYVECEYYHEDLKDIYNLKMLMVIWHIILNMAMVI